MVMKAAVGVLLEDPDGLEMEFLAWLFIVPSHEGVDFFDHFIEAPVKVHEEFSAILIATMDCNPRSAFKTFKTLSKG
jgi:hypothetical protein